MNRKVTIDHYSNSSISSFLTCPAKFYFAYVKNLEPSSKNINLEFGSSIHVACEKALKKVKNKSLTAATTIILQYNFLAEFNAKELPDHKQKNGDIGINLMTKFYDIICDYPPESIIAIEKKYEKTIKGFKYVGILDLILEQKGRRIITDHKTTSKTPRSFNNWNLSRQLIGYHWLADGDETCVNLFITVVVPTKRSSKSLGPRILQPLFLFSQKQVDRWVYQTLGHMKDIDRHITSYNQWIENQSKFLYVPDALFPRVGSACNVYGCEFETLCIQDVPLEEIIPPFDQFQQKEERK